MNSKDLSQRRSITKEGIVEWAEQRSKSMGCIKLYSLAKRRRVTNAIERSSSTMPIFEVGQKQIQAVHISTSV